MPDPSHAFAAVLVCAACTAFVRAAPFALFGGRRKMPPAVERLAAKLPAAIIAVLVVYCLKGVPDQSTTDAVVTLASVAAVVALHLWKRNTLLSIAGGTALYMALLRIF